MPLLVAVVPPITTLDTVPLVTDPDGILTKRYLPALLP